jgi:hypothetical protein
VAQTTASVDTFVETFTAATPLATMLNTKSNAAANHVEHEEKGHNGDRESVWLPINARGEPSPTEFQADAEEENWLCQSDAAANAYLEEEAQGELAHAPMIDLTGMESRDEPQRKKRRRNGEQRAEQRRRSMMRKREESLQEQRRRSRMRKREEPLQECIKEEEAKELQRQAFWKGVHSMRMTNIMAGKSRLGSSAGSSNELPAMSRHKCAVCTRLNEVQS